MSYSFDQPMYQQPAYEPDRPAPVDDGDLLSNYEIKSWVRGPRLYKIFALSAVLNLAIVLFAAETSLLTRKGCDSPLVGSVCQVLDTVYVGNLLFGTDREYVDAVYDRTELGDDDDITFVDVSHETPPLTYPAGYFEIANPAPEFAVVDDSVDDLGGDFTTGNIPGIPPGIPLSHPNNGRTLFDTPQHLPKTNPNPIAGELPGMGGHTGSIPIAKGRRGLGGRVKQPAADPSASPSPSPDETTAGNTNPAEPAPTPLSSEAVTGVQINKKPLTDFADTVAALWESKEVDLNQDFRVVLNGVLTADGKLDKKKSKFDVSKQVGDPNMINIGKSALEAVSDSGWLQYLKLVNTDVDKFTATLFQDNDKVVVQISMVRKTPERAQTLSSGLNGIIMAGKLTAKNPSDERVLLDGASTTAEKNTTLLNFVLPKPIAQEMITRKLREAQAKKAQQGQPNVTEPTKPATPPAG